MTVSTVSHTDIDTIHSHGALTGSAVMAPARIVLVTAAAASSLWSAIAALYLFKSALGINLMPGHSPLHDLLYHLIR